jgi:hypothetical protein
LESSCWRLSSNGLANLYKVLPDEFGAEPQMMAGMSDILFLHFAALRLAGLTRRDGEARIAAMGTKMKPGTALLRTIA